MALTVASDYIHCRLEYSKDFIKREQSRLADPRIAEALRVELSYLTDLTSGLSSVLEAWRETTIRRLRSRIQTIHEESLNEAIANYAASQFPRNLNSGPDDNIVGNSIPSETQQAVNLVENTYEIPQASTPGQVLPNEASDSDGYLPIVGVATTTTPTDLPLLSQYSNSLQSGISIQVSTPFDAQHAMQPIAERPQPQQDHHPRRTAVESAAAFPHNSSDSSLEQTESGRSSWIAENEIGTAITASNIDHEDNMFDHSILGCCKGSELDLFPPVDLDWNSPFPDYTTTTR